MHSIAESEEDFKIEEKMSEDSDEILGSPQMKLKRNILWDLFSKLHLDNPVLKGKRTVQAKNLNNKLFSKEGDIKSVINNKKSKKSKFGKNDYFISKRDWSSE